MNRPEPSLYDCYAPFFKNGLRIAAGACLFLGRPDWAGVLLILAELLAIDIKQNS